MMFTLNYLHFTLSHSVSSPYDPLLMSNHSHPNHTISPIPQTTFYSLCSNFSSCDECMNAESTHNIQCSWIQHRHRPNSTDSSDDTENADSTQCVPTTECETNTEIECCDSLVCCNCLAQTNCIKCGSQGLNESCLWDHTHTKCFTPDHECSGK